MWFEPSIPEKLTDGLGKRKILLRILRGNTKDASEFERSELVHARLKKAIGSH